MLNNLKRLETSMQLTQNPSKNTVKDNGSS